MSANKKNLLIVESPAKARTISQYLGNDFQVKATMGHIKDLPKSSFGVDIEHDFEPHYEVIKGKHKVLKDLKTIAKNAGKIYLAPDPDREGEAIAFHVQEELLKVVKDTVPICRAVFSEITKEAVKGSLNNCGPVDMQKVQAQQTRRILDRIVGYKISPLLWKSLKKGLSAGRVQSVALRLICEREREIQEFKPREYWTIEAEFADEKGNVFASRLFKIEGKEPDILNNKQARSHEERISGLQFSVSALDKKKRLRRALPPFITSTLQQEAARRLKFSAKKTMFVAQQLYEGVQLGQEGMVGLITYMRTDSTRISKKALDTARSYISAAYGKEYLPSSPNVFRQKKGSQDAHEAIRPTDSFMHPPQKIAPYLSKEQLNLYRLVFERFIASQMKPAVYDQTTVDIIKDSYHFRSIGNILQFDGFLKVYQYKEDDSKEEDSKNEEKSLPDLKIHEALKTIEIKPEQHFTKPLPRYTEAGLIKMLEEKGIGRPSTYAAIVATIQERHYAAKEKGSFYPTELGILVNDLLVNFFPDIVDIQFTAKMEEELDKIEDGGKDYNKLLRGFYDIFMQRFAVAEKGIKKALVTDIKCDKCQAAMAIRVGRNGVHFLGCSSYPQCSNIKEFTLLPSGKIQFKEPSEPEESDEICEKCQSKMLVKIGRFGKFLACSAYPDCRNTRPLKNKKQSDQEITCSKCANSMAVYRSSNNNYYALCTQCQTGYPLYLKNQYLFPELVIQCDKCSGKMILRKKRKGYDRFLGCEKFPKCKNIQPFDTGIPCSEKGTFFEKKIRGKTVYQCSENPRIIIYGKIPVAKKCPECGCIYLIEEYTPKTNILHEKCMQKDCSYVQKINLVKTSQEE